MTDTIPTHDELDAVRDELDAVRERLAELELQVHEKIDALDKIDALEQENKTLRTALDMIGDMSAAALMGDPEG